jgi:hypothetical protein
MSKGNIATAARTWRSYEFFRRPILPSPASKYGGTRWSYQGKKKIPRDLFIPMGLVFLVIFIFTTALKQAKASKYEWSFNFLKI